MIHITSAPQHHDVRVTQSDFAAEMWIAFRVPNALFEAACRSPHAFRDVIEQRVLDVLEEWLYGKRRLPPKAQGPLVAEFIGTGPPLLPEKT